MIALGVLIVAGAGITLYSIDQLKERLMGQVEDLRAAIAQVGTDLGEAVARVSDKIDSLGEPDPDLSADIANLQGISSQLDALAADEAPPVVEPPVEPPVVEPPVQPPTEPPLVDDSDPNA